MPGKNTTEMMFALKMLIKDGFTVEVGIYFHFHCEPILYVVSLFMFAMGMDRLTDQIWPESPWTV